MKHANKEKKEELRQRIGRMDWPDVSVLNVEDHEPARFLRTRTLEAGGYSVEEAASAEEALAVATAKPSIRLALLDVGLPDGDGFGLCEQLKAQRPDLPVVMITSIYRSRAARLQGLEMGADEYLLDPLPDDRLVRTLDRVLAGSPASDGWVVITTDPFGMMLGISATASRLLHVSARAALGRSLLTFVGADRDRAAKALQMAAAGLVVQEELILRPRERKPQVVEAHLDGGDHRSRTVEWRIRPL
jgi:DNA-binding response OmpR family regulator